MCDKWVKSGKNEEKGNKLGSVLLKINACKLAPRWRIQSGV